MPTKPRVEPAHGAALVPKQFLAEVLDLDAEVRAVEPRRVEAGVAREPLADRLALRRGQRVPLRERGRIVGRGELLDLVEDGAKGLRLQVGGELLVVPGRGRVRRKEERVGKVVSLREPGRLEVEDRRHEEDAVEGDALVDEVARETGGAGRAVALAHEEERRRPALVPREIEADELADGGEVALHAPELLSELGLDGDGCTRSRRDR